MTDSERLDAERQAETIMRYWAALGHVVKVHVDRMMIRSGKSIVPSDYYVLRSNLRNGLPQ